MKEQELTINQEIRKVMNWVENWKTAAGCASERKPTRTVTLSPDRQIVEIVFHDGETAVEYLTITYEGGGLCVASSVRMGVEE